MVISGMLGNVVLNQELYSILQLLIPIMCRCLLQAAALDAVTNWLKFLKRLVMAYLQRGLLEVFQD